MATLFPGSALPGAAAHNEVSLEREAAVNGRTDNCGPLQFDHRDRLLLRDRKHLSRALLVISAPTAARKLPGSLPMFPFISLEEEGFVCT